MKQDYWTYNKPLSMTGFGGGATSLSNAGGALFSFDDAAYSEFFTSGAYASSPINISNSSYDTFMGTSGSVNGPIGGISPFYDHDAQEIYSTVCTGVSSHNLTTGASGWSNGGSSYSGNANLYKISSTNIRFAGHPSAGYASDGRGLTVAYLQDNTAVIISGHASSGKLFFYYYSNKNYIGYLTLSSSNSGFGSGNETSSLCFSGTHIIVASRDNENYIYGYDLPANVSAINNGSINHSLRWAKPSGSDFVTGYGAAWGGGNRIYLGQFLYNSPDNTSAAQYLLSDNGNNGTSTLVATYTGSFSSNRGCAIDYKNRKLVVGGRQSNEINVFGE